MSSTIAGKKIVPMLGAPARSTALWSSVKKFDRILDNLSSRESYIFQRIVESTKNNDYRASKILARELTYTKLVRTKLEQMMAIMLYDAKKQLNNN